MATLNQVTLLSLQFIKYCVLRLLRDRKKFNALLAEDEIESIRLILAHVAI